MNSTYLLGIIMVTSCIALQGTVILESPTLGEQYFTVQSLERLDFAVYFLGQIRDVLCTLKSTCPRGLYRQSNFPVPHFKNYVLLSIENPMLKTYF